MIIVAKENARKHITSISYCHFCRDKIVCPRSMRAASSVYVNIYSKSFLSVWDYKTKTKIAIWQKCRNINRNKEDSVSSVLCLHRYESKSHQTKVDISVNLRSASPPCAVKAQLTECGMKSFWFPNFFKWLSANCCAQLQHPDHHPYATSKQNSDNTGIWNFLSCVCS